jgi:hypothetical protein
VTQATGGEHDHSAADTHASELLASKRPAKTFQDRRSLVTRAREWFLATAEEEPPPESKPLCPPDVGRIGICCSGGGIRSAAYNLGALQVLRKRGLLDEAEYLAAVSGGSYIAAAHVTVATCTDAKLLEREPTFGPGSPEEVHLRNHSSYMAPGLGGKVRLFLRMLFGLAVTLVFLAAVLLPLGVALGWLFAEVLYPEMQGPISDSLEMSDGVLLVGGVLAGLGALLALPDLLMRMDGERWRRFREAWSYRLLVAGAIAVVLLALLPAALVELRLAAPDVGPASTDDLVKAIGGDEGPRPEGSGLLQLINLGSVLVAAAGAARAFLTSKRSYFALAAGAIAGPLIVLSLFALFVNGAAERGFADDFDIGLALIAVGILLISVAVADLTQWSLHPFYRSRLSSAFFVRRELRGPGSLGSPTDVVAREAPQKDQLKLTTIDPKEKLPELIVCAAANVSDDGATPPGRGATSFTFSRRELGGSLVGWISSETYQEEADRAMRDVTLPAAVAMSGAAVSPSMGKQSIRALTFLLALTNVRLGVWLPNPRWVEDLKTSHFKVRRRMRPPPWYFFHELLGRNKINHKYLYISDGGHYENLGFVELLRRGCTTVFAFDASGDRTDTFNTLGDAVSLARSEVQVDVEIDPHRLRPDKETKLSETDHVLGSFRYLTADVDGTLVFSKAAITDDAPWDVKAFHEADNRFPNHSTFDQLFDDQKFESYRALGAHTAQRAVDSWMEHVTTETARRILTRWAQRREHQRFATLVEAIRAEVPKPVEPPADVERLLRALDEQEVAAGRPPLCALVDDLAPAGAPANGSIRIAARFERNARRQRVWAHWRPAESPPEPAGADAADRYSSSASGGGADRA